MLVLTRRQLRTKSGGNELPLLGFINFQVLPFRGSALLSLELLDQVDLPCMADSHGGSPCSLSIWDHC